MVKLEFIHEGYKVSYDSSKCIYWTVSVDGQEREFRSPTDATSHIDRVVGLQPLVGQTFLTLDDGYGNKKRDIVKLTIAGTYFHDDDDGSPMGLFLMDQNGKPVYDNNLLCVPPDKKSLLEDYVKLDKEIETLFKKRGKIYGKIKKCDPTEGLPRY